MAVIIGEEEAAVGEATVKPLREAQGQLELDIRNPSPPIDAELVEGLFDPFKRSAIRNARNPGSMGLGLYIVDQVARAHGGQIRYEPGEGEVIFVLSLPLQPAPAG